MTEDLYPHIYDIKRVCTEALEELDTYKEACERVYQWRVDRRNAFIRQEKEKYLQFLANGNDEMCTRYEEWSLPSSVEIPPTMIYSEFIERVLYWISKEDYYKVFHERHPDIQNLEEIEKYGYSLKIQKWLKDEPQYNSVFDDDCSDTSVSTL